MTPEAVVAAARKKKHIVIVHRGSAFFNTTDSAEAEKWAAQGARIVPHYTESEIQTRSKKGRRTTQGWEVHLLGAVERIETPDADGDLVDITNDLLLAAARETVGV